MSRFFQNREGQTPLEEDMRFDLKLKHVQDMTELYELEIENIALGIAWCQGTSVNHLDYAQWIELHRRMYGEVWKFAGVIRKTELNNPDFLMPFEVRPALLGLEKDLKFWLAENSYSPKEMLAIFHERLLTIHPFKDGNGRWARVLTEFISTRENIPTPNWGVAIKDDDERRQHYLAAIKAARHESNFEKLIWVMWNEVG